MNAAKAHHNLVVQTDEGKLSDNQLENVVGGATIIPIDNAEAMERQATQFLRGSGPLTKVGGGIVGGAIVLGGIGYGIYKAVHH